MNVEMLPVCIQYMHVSIVFFQIRKFMWPRK